MSGVAQEGLEPALEQNRRVSVFETHLTITVTEVIRGARNFGGFSVVRTHHATLHGLKTAAKA